MNIVETQLEQTINLVRTWPPERQQDAVLTLLAMQEARAKLYELSEDEEQAIQLGVTQALRGERMSDEAMAAFFDSHKIKDVSNAT